MEVKENLHFNAFNLLKLLKTKSISEIILDLKSDLTDKQTIPPNRENKQIKLFLRHYSSKFRNNKCITCYLIRF